MIEVVDMDRWQGDTLPGLYKFKFLVTILELPGPHSYMSEMVLDPAKQRGRKEVAYEVRTADSRLVGLSRLGMSRGPARLVSLMETAYGGGS